MITIYRLQLDKNYIAQVQQATEGTEQFGIEPTYGVFASPEWWQHIRQGTLPIHHVKGTISSVGLSSMNDWPEFTLRTDGGDESTWSRFANRPEFGSLYSVGRLIEIDYVIQRHRLTSPGSATEVRIPIAIRIDEQ